MRWLKKLIIVVLCLIVAFIGVSFAWLNTDKISVDLFFVTLPEASLSLWLMASFVIGGVAGVSATAVGLMFVKTQLRAAKKKVEQANQELDRLRTTSLKHSA